MFQIFIGHPRDTDWCRGDPIADDGDQEIFERVWLRVRRQAYDLANSHIKSVCPRCGEERPGWEALVWDDVKREVVRHDVWHLTFDRGGSPLDPPADNPERESP